MANETITVRHDRKLSGTTRYKDSIRGAGSLISISPRRRTSDMASVGVMRALQKDGEKIGRDFERTLRRFGKSG